MYNKIFTTCNFLTKQWEVKHNEVFPGAGILAINFVTGPDMLFNNTFTVGYNFYVENELVSSDDFPKFRMLEGTISSSYSIEPPIDFVKDKPQRIHLWAELDDMFIEHNIVLENLIPPKPYPSWSYINGTWTPPIPQPEKGIWSWDEDNQTWKLNDDQYMPGSAGTLTWTGPID